MMHEQRYQELQWGQARLTPEEIEEGWHWCPEMDGLLCRLFSDSCFCQPLTNQKGNDDDNAIRTNGRES